MGSFYKRSRLPLSVSNGEVGVGPNPVGTGVPRVDADRVTPLSSNRAIRTRVSRVSPGITTSCKHSVSQEPGKKET